MLPEVNRHGPSIGSRHEVAAHSEPLRYQRRFPDVSDAVSLLHIQPTLYSMYSLEPMIMQLAIRLVAKHVKALAAKRLIALVARETLAVPFPLELTVRGGDGRGLDR